MRIGIFGGSFDPPHVGHLLTALDAIEALDLEQLLVVPAAVQPFKTDGRTSAAHRLAMVRCCFDGVPRVDVDPLEMERGGLSFTVDTVEALRRRWPSADLHLLVGEDAAATFAQWREPERLLTMTQLVVLQRGGIAGPAAASSLFLGLEDRPGVRPAIQLATRRVDVSSTEIRERVRNGHPIQGFVPDAVAAYIASTGLYLQEPSTSAGPSRA